jgi:hypothetical protein
LTGIDVGGQDKFQNLGQLSIWGIVYIESGGAGFAMEFIGDMADSTIGGNVNNLKPVTSNALDPIARIRSGVSSVPENTAPPGRGIN